MASSFFFYDLETTGANPALGRVVQFAGQRTTRELAPVGEPINVMIRLTPDIVPDPDAVLITGITPQQTIQHGITEYEFLQIFWEQVALPNTIFVGFNSVRFDDEFMRYMLYRNFYDPYEWQWQAGRSRWDLLDVVRMTRALRPAGITWPVDAAGKSSNRLELLAAVNAIDHYAAHDALSDVYASIAVARMLQQAQPKLFAYLLQMRDKTIVQQLVAAGQPFVYCSGRYATEYEKTTVATMIATHPKKAAALVYDLRHDPTPLLALSPPELRAVWQSRTAAPAAQFPIKTLSYNRCPAIAPLRVLDAASQERLQLDMALVQAHARVLQANPDFALNVRRAAEHMEHDLHTQRNATPRDVDAQLYDGFIAQADKPIQAQLRAAHPEDIAGFASRFQDARLQALVPLYKARNFPKALSSEEAHIWHEHCADVLLGGGDDSRLARFFNRLAQLDQDHRTTEEQRYLLTELQLYGQSLLPADW